TLDTPHFGSPCANVLLALRNSTGTGRIIYQGLRRFMDLDGGAIDDLKVGSDSLGNIGPAKVPSYAIVGTGGSDFIMESYPIEAFISNQMLRVLAFVARLSVRDYLDYLFGGELHDLFVSERSQLGGLPRITPATAE